MNIHDGIRMFLEHVEVSLGRSLKTINNYQHYLDFFVAHSKISSVEDVTDDVVHQFRLFLNRHAGRGGSTIKKNTQNYYLIALRVFLKYMHTRGVKTLAPDSIILAKTGMRELELISIDELKRIRDAVGSKTIEDVRDKAIIETLFSTGLRVSELVGLPRSLDLTKKEMSIRGKGEKVRVVFFTDTAISAIQTYLQKREDMSEALFAGKGTNAIPARSVQRIIQKYARKAGVSKKVTPHVLRHMFATTLLSNGADIRSVQELLGHANIATTQVYTHVTNKRLKDVHKQFLHE
ncbi:MAG: tyrosine-type recombinase/integrase [Alphaproteobacteria bacterium]|nr:tyrosine-type recombinase/integrase [Alphaproteobacteria bacterium]